MGATAPTHWCECAHKHKFDAKPPSSTSPPFASVSPAKIAPSAVDRERESARALACTMLRYGRTAPPPPPFLPPPNPHVCVACIYIVCVCATFRVHRAQTAPKRGASLFCCFFFRCSHCWRPSRRADEQQQRVGPLNARTGGQIV